MVIYPGGTHEILHHGYNQIKADAYDISLYRTSVQDLCTGQKIKNCSVNPYKSLTR
jgi:hypothetical protein